MVAQPLAERREAAEAVLAMPERLQHRLAGTEVVRSEAMWPWARTRGHVHITAGRSAVHGAGTERAAANSSLDTAIENASSGSSPCVSPTRRSMLLWADDVSRGLPAAKLEGDAVPPSPPAEGTTVDSFSLHSLRSRLWVLAAAEGKCWRKKYDKRRLLGACSLNNVNAHGLAEFGEPDRRERPLFWE